jgi:phage terminase small subunit
MQRGPKPISPTRKKLAGTFKPCVDDATAPIVQLVKDIPVAPDWLTDGAKAVWADDLARVVACGATSVDSNMFGLYCTSMADFIASVKLGEPANAAFRSELRKQMEMLCIAGAKSRLARISTDVKTSSPFSVRPQ